MAGLRLSDTEAERHCVVLAVLASQRKSTTDRLVAAVGLRDRESFGAPVRVPKVFFDMANMEY
jgi:hypothetical protein